MEYYTKSGLESDFIMKVFFINTSVRFYIFLGVLNFGFFKEFCSFQKLERGLRKSLSSSLPVTMLNRARVVRVHFLHKPSKGEVSEPREEGDLIL